MDEGNIISAGRVILSYDDNARLSDLEEMESIVEMGLGGEETFYQLYRRLSQTVFQLGSLQGAFAEITSLLLENYLH